jgi:hypothetical protein
MRNVRYLSRKNNTNRVDWTAERARSVHAKKWLRTAPLDVVHCHTNRSNKPPMVHWSMVPIPSVPAVDAIPLLTCACIVMTYVPDERFRMALETTVSDEEVSPR